jgi:DNA-directed RNA polymerase specialized sigma24 family protein
MSAYDQDTDKPLTRAAGQQLLARLRRMVAVHLDPRTTAEVAAVLGLSESAVKMRHRRALDRLSRVLGDDSEGGPS